MGWEQLLLFGEVTEWSQWVVETLDNLVRKERKLSKTFIYLVFQC